jgi:hypothetical protein
MLAKLEPTMEEHARRITSKEIHNHYLGPRIQNELILMMALQVKKTIAVKVEITKYFAAILDCTPDASHREQLCFMLCHVDVSSEAVKVTENVTDFTRVQKQTGQGLTHSLLAAIDGPGLHISDCKGQGYNKGANMKGQGKGVQARILHIHSRTFFSPCNCHNFHLVSEDMAKCNSKAMSFFRIM